MRTDGRKDRHDEANSRFFRNFAIAPKNNYFVIRKQLRISSAEFGRMTMQSVL
jgi:hypothetical protein